MKDIDGTKLENVTDIQGKLLDLKVDHWSEHGLFSANWWLLLVLLTLPWILWWFLVDRSRLFKILTLGLMVSIIANLLDTLGISWGLWVYKMDIVPGFPQLIPIDHSVLPVGYMLVYQFFPKWKHFLIVSVIASLFGAFIVEQTFVHIGIYKMIVWKHIYSVPFYILIAIGVKVFVDHVLGKIRDRKL
ncbi:CBO0543 family protein [Pseudalkalibacillus decolorationis]|uniref:CBO0543 family protein n=1 Tax=Pseudalkalibacillus decolorationis TaxID=163879 RepID=UPI00214864F4|nr:CBO0543 family protein [Pseudalkalibacillus decolorationis]